MQEIGDAGAGDRDRKRQRPVRERSVSTWSELQQQPRDDHEHLEAAAAEVAVRLEVVRRRLTAGSRQDLDHPEDEDDLRNLRRDRQRQETTDQRKLGVARLDHPPDGNHSAPNINRPRGPIIGGTHHPEG